MAMASHNAARFQRSRAKITKAATSTTARICAPSMEKTFMRTVRPGEANWWTQLRMVSSKRSVSPVRISRPSQTKTNKQRMATARLMMMATSKNAIGSGLISVLACGSCASDISAPGFARCEAGNQLVQFGQQGLIAASRIRLQFFRIERQVKEKRLYFLFVQLFPES